MLLSAGIDTWSVGWYLRSDSEAEKAIDTLATGRAKRFSVLPEAVLDHKVLWDRSHRFLVAEGHPDPDGLAPVDADGLLAVQEALADGLRDRGVEVPRSPAPFDRTGSPGAAGVRRLDLAVDVQGDRDHGRALLSGVAAVEPPGRLRSVVHRAQTGRQVETISWQGARGKVGRVYDKGVEQLTHHPGERVRFEDQRRYPAGARPLVEDLSAGYAGAMFRQRFGVLVKATKGVVVASQQRCIEALEDLVQEGELTPAQACKILGFQMGEQAGVDFGIDRSTKWRYRQMVREAGVVLTQSALEEEIEIDLGARLEQVLDEAIWAGS
jgi:hypothetical protein